MPVSVFLAAFVVLLSFTEMATIISPEISEPNSTGIRTVAPSMASGLLHSLLAFSTK
jgi:hypothetical protein